MDLDAFWRIVDEARSGTLDDEVFLGRIAGHLDTLTPADLLAFQTHFNNVHAASYAWRLWGAAYLMNGGCSDDGFEYFRAWLIAQGRKTFEAVIEEPDMLASVATNAEGELEEFMYLAPQAYEAKTGEEMPEAVLLEAVRPELGEGWDFEDAAEMAARYPKLFAKYGG